MRLGPLRWLILGLLFHKHAPDFNRDGSVLRFPFIFLLVDPCQGFSLAGCV